MTSPTDDKKYCRVPARIISKYGDNIPFDIYLKLSDSKIVRVGPKDGNVSDIVEKYLAKGACSIYALEGDYNSFLKTIQESLKNKFFDSSLTSEKTQDLSAAFEMSKESLQKIGLTKESIALAKEVTKKSMKLIQEQPSIYDFFREFKNNCAPEYINNVLVAYTALTILEHFEWSTDQMKEKMSLATMLRDVMLEAEDFKEVKTFYQNHQHDHLSERVKNHPIHTANTLQAGRGNWIAHEVCTIIRQHHELPNGAGFPAGLTLHNITPPSAIHIVADHFIFLMIENNFDLQSKRGIFEKLEKIFPSGHFKKSLNSLKSAIGYSH